MNDTMILPEVMAPPAITRPRVSRKRLLGGVAGLVLLAGAVWFAQDWWVRGRFIQTTDDAYVGGEVTAIAPHIAGIIQSVAVTDNQHVQAGQTLLRLVPDDAAAALDQARATLAQQRSVADGLEARRALQSALIGEAQASLRSAEAHDGFARQEADRYAVLARSAAGSRQDAQRSTSARDEADAAVVAAQARLAAAGAQMQVLVRQIEAARAAITAAEAAQRLAVLNLGYTDIRSPIDGYVANRAARVGAYAATGSYLLSVVPASALWVDANFKEDQLARIRPGQPATVVADAEPGHRIAAHVVSLSAGTGAVFSVIPPENATGNFTKIVQRVPVRVALDGDPAELAAMRAGLSATVSIDTRE